MVKDVIGLLLQFSLMLIVLGIGLQSRLQDLTSVFRRPDVLLRAFIAVNVIVPLTATALAQVMPMAWLSKVGVVLMAVSPLAPFAPGKMLKAGADTAFVNAVYVVLIFASVVIVPLTIMLLNTISPQQVQVPEAALIVLVAKSVLVPIVIGLVVAHFWPDFAQRAAPIARIVAFAIIIPLALMFLYKTFGALMAVIGDGTLITIVLVIGAGILGGHLLGGRSIEHRGAMAQAAATRHPGMAILIARRNFDDPEVIMAIVLFLLISIVMCTIYARWERGVVGRVPPAQAE